MRAILALALAACTSATQQFPLPANVGESHDLTSLTSAEIAKPQTPQTLQTLQPVPQPWRSESVDPEIFAILLAAHAREVDEGRVAQERASDPAILKFADMLVSDHAQAFDREVELVQSLDMGSWETGTSRRMHRDSFQKVEQLKALSGAEFDKQYLDNVVSQHAEMLRMIDSKLIPNVGSRELTAAIDSVRTSVTLHLTEARELQRR
jgi:putative membrane protein